MQSSLAQDLSLNVDPPGVLTLKPSTASTTARLIRRAVLRLSGGFRLRRSSVRVGSPVRLGIPVSGCALCDPMRRCTACAHPDRAAIDDDLAAGLSLRTVAGRHGLSTSAVHRHQTRHLDKPTVGEIRQAGEWEEWQQWDGRRWVNIKMPNIVDDLIELQRSVHAKYRRGWTKLNPNAKYDQLYQFTRNVYRLRPGARIIRIDD